MKKTTTLFLCLIFSSFLIFLQNSVKAKSFEGRFNTLVYTKGIDVNSNAVTTKKLVTKYFFVNKNRCTPPLAFTTTALNYTVCAGTVSTKTLSIILPELGVTYSWSASGASGVSFTPTIGTTTVMSYTASSSFTITATGENACGTNTSTSTVLVNALPTVVAVATPTSVCAGSTLTLNGLGANSYTWSNLVIDGLTFIPTTSSTYSVTGTDVNNCSNTAVINVPLINYPTVTVTGANYVCLNQTDVLTASGANTFTWMPGSIISNTLNAQTSTNSTYTVTGEVSGCNNTTTFAVNIITPQTPQICLVTTDSTSQYNYNIIHWDNSQYTQVDSFIVYRSDATLSNYLQIGAVSKDSSQLMDTARSVFGPNGGDPNYASYKYTLAIKDVCGNLSIQSPYHQTVFLQDQHNGNFTINQYVIGSGQANPVIAYALLKDLGSGLGYIYLTTITSLLGTDPLYTNTPNANYRADAIGFNCVSNQRLASGYNNTDAVRAKSHSNTSKRLTSGISPYANLDTQISVYPNPANNVVHINCSIITNKTIITMYDATGRILLQQPCTNGNQTQTIDIQNIQPGMYFVEIGGVRKIVTVSK